MSSGRLPVTVSMMAASLLIAAGPVMAADGMIDEIIVTVQKRAQSLQDVPVSVSAFSGQFMERANIRDLDDLVDLTPGFSGKTNDSFTDALAIRGISTNDFGLGGDPSVAIFVDGVYEGRNGGAITTFLDVAQAEVVRGPQNTLFGRNAIAGAISVTTNKPEEEFGGKVAAAIEQYDHYELQGTINVPLTDSWFFRGSAYYMTEDGYLDNLAGGRDLGEKESLAFQTALRYVRGGLDSTLTLFYEDRKSDPSIYWPTAALDADGNLDPDGTRLPRDKVATDLSAKGRGIDDPEVFRATLNVEAELDGGYTLTSITGYKTYDFFYREDYDATPRFVNDYEVDQEVDYFSQEFRLNSPDNGRLVWFAGASFYVEDAKARFANRYSEDELCRALPRTEVGDADDPDEFTWAPGTAVTGCADPVFVNVWGDGIDPADIDNDKAEVNVNRGDYWGWAIYADGTFALTDRLDLTLGARYTFDRKKFSVDVLDSGGALGNNLVWEFFTDGAVSASDDWSSFTPRAALNYTINDSWSVFGNLTWGYKSGGFSTFGLELPDEPDEDGLVPEGTKPRKFDSEDVLSAEAGVRARLYDGRLQVNASIYQYKYDDLQLLFFEDGSQLTDNVAEATGRGLEVDARWLPNERWDFALAVAWNDTEIDRVDQDFLDVGGCDDCAGNELWFSPAWSTSVQGTYRHPLGNGADLFLTAEHHYQDDMFSGPDNLALATTPGWSEFNFRLGYESGRNWTVIAYVENAFDEKYFERGWENADADNLYGYGLVNTLVWPSKPRVFGVRMDWSF